MRSREIEGFSYRYSKIFNFVNLYVKTVKQRDQRNCDSFPTAVSNKPRVHHKWNGIHKHIEETIFLKNLGFQEGTDQLMNTLKTLRNRKTYSATQNAVFSNVPNNLNIVLDCQNVSLYVHNTYPLKTREIVFKTRLFMKYNQWSNCRLMEFLRAMGIIKYICQTTRV